MTPKGYRWCTVPQCKNTSIKTPEKVFIFVPFNKTIRNKWLKLARRDVKGLLPTTQIYFCEDHFDLEKDMANYMKYKMGFARRMVVADGALPSKFHCQEGRERRSRLCDRTTSRPVFVKRRRHSLIKQIEEEYNKTDASVIEEKKIVKTKDESDSEDYKAAKDTCNSCNKVFDGFIYQCIQCEYLLCSACDAVGVHKSHYMLRCPANSPKTQVETVLSKVREAVKTVQWRVDSETDDASIPDAPTIPDDSSVPHYPSIPDVPSIPHDPDDGNALEPNVVVKLEFEVAEEDPLIEVKQEVLDIKLEFPGYSPNPEPSSYLSEEHSTTELVLHPPLTYEPPGGTHTFPTPVASTSTLPSASWPTKYVRIPPTPPKREGTDHSRTQASVPKRRPVILRRLR